MARRRQYKMKKPLPILIGLIIVLVGYYFTSLKEEQNFEYGSNQDNKGYYYYTYVDSNDYYYSANDLTKLSLKNELNQIISENFEPASYKEAQTYLQESDVSLEDDTKVYNVYDGVLAPRVWDSSSWHREHVWPNSRLGLKRVQESNRSIASDLHNLRAVTPRINSMRSDRFYSDGFGDAHTTEDKGFYPGDDHKGDVARIILYMAVMYEDLTLTDDLDLLLDEADHYTPDGARMGQLSLLLKWHREDPVDDFEKHRNDVIYQIQKNRNPFIDKPEYVHLIWENKQIDDLLQPTEIKQNQHLMISILGGITYETPFV